MTNKTVLVTGGSRGIGEALVKRFHSEGWTVATCATRLKNLDNSPAKLKFECDVADSDTVKQVVNEIAGKVGRIDALINNAGLSGSNPLTPESSDYMWHRILSVNLHGTYYMCKNVLPHLPDSTGRIVNISSVLGLKGVPDASAYCTAKHGVLGLTRSLAHQLAPRGITVNAVCPGWVRTDMAQDRMQDIGITENDLKASVPLKRFVEPDEVADFVFYLVTSRGSGMITGQALTIDGGTLP